MKMFLVVAALFAAVPAVADPLKAGDRFPEIQLKDQHDAAAPIAPDTRVVLFSHDMDGAGLLEDSLENGGQSKLDAAKAVVLSDISRMPGFVTAMFALPAMRRRPYRMILDREGKATADLPRVDDHVTVVWLKEQAIEKVEYADSPAKLAPPLTAVEAR